MGKKHASQYANFGWLLDILLMSYFNEITNYSFPPTPLNLSIKATIF